MSNKSDSIPNSDQPILQGEPSLGGDMSGDPCVRGPTPTRCDKAGKPYELERLKSFRFPSRSTETPEYNVEVHRRSVQSIQLCDESGELPPAGKRFRSGGLHGRVQEQEINQDPIDIERYSGGLTSGRSRGFSRRVFAPKPSQGKGLSRILNSSRKTFAVCRGPNTKGPCSSCRSLLLELESRDCFLAESESEAEEDSSTEAIVDLCSSGDGEDFINIDD